MNLFKRVISTLLSATLALTFAGAFAACGESEDGKIDYTVTARDLEQNKIEGVDLKIWDEEGYTEIAAASTNANGVAVFELDEGRYELEIVDIPVGYDIASWYEMIDVNEESTSIELVLSADTEDGSAEHPYTLIVGDDSTSQISLDANATNYYRVRNMAGARLMIESEDVSVGYANQTYTANAGVIEVLIERSEDTYDFKTFTVTNLTDGAVTIDVVLYCDPGTRENPLVIEQANGEVTCEVVGEGRVYYKWTATADGIFALHTLSQNSDIVMSNLRTSVTTVRRDSTVQQSISVEVFVGDVVLIEVNAFDAQEAQSYTITFDCVFYA